ncbi:MULTISPECIES: OmpA family protein [unclassified Chromobacterium]|uniref:OmpA family protein n=1 Tax=unclassified Chromobacterium TaxID=2641838 RepID=UPI000A7D3683|nr:OmpA family protein [Chromobacterium sp. LK1]
MKRLLMVAALACLALAGCKTNPNAQQASKDPAVIKAAEEKAALDKAVAANMAIDPNLIPFEKMSPKLSPVGEAQLQLLLPKLKTAKSILVRGHCYRGDIGNARAAAQTRAIAVKQVLTDAGIPAGKISVRYDTERQLHAVRIVAN